MTEVEEEFASLLKHERERSPVVSAESRERVLGNLASALAATGASALGLSALHATSKSAAVALQHSTLFKVSSILSLGFALGAGSHAAYVHLRSPAIPSAIAIPLARSITMPAEPSVARPVEPAGIDPLSLPSASSSSVREPSAAASETSSDRERLLLESAQSALSHGSASEALRSLQKHRANYPKSQLAEERDALEIRSLLALGQRENAGTAFSTFQARYPQSLQNRSLSRALALPKENP
jgi:hypothetical protein